MKKSHLLALLLFLLSLAACSSRSTNEKSAPQAYVLIEFGASWCAPCHLLAREILEHFANRPRLEEVYSSISKVDVDVDAANPAARLLMDEYQTVTGLPLVVVVALDQPLPATLLSGDGLTQELAQFLVDHGTKHGEKNGYVSALRDTYMQWLMNPKTQAEERELVSLAWSWNSNVTREQILEAAYTLTQELAFDEAKPYWERLRETTDKKLVEDPRWQMVALRVGKRNGDPADKEIVKKAAAELVRAKAPFGKEWICDAMEVDPTLRTQVVQTYASGAASTEQKRDVLDCAAQSAGEEKNIVAAREYYRRTAELQRQFIEDQGESTMLGERLMLGYYLAQYDLEDALRYLDTLKAEHPFLARSEQAGYLEEADRFSEAIQVRLAALPYGKGMDAVKHRSRLAKSYAAIGQYREAVQMLNEAISLVKQVIGSPELNRTGEKSTAHNKWAKWIEDYEKRIKEYEDNLYAR